MSKKNEISLLEQAQERASIMSDSLINAVNVHAGESAIQLKTDSDGKEYLSATFKLKSPTKKMDVVVVNDMAVAESLERIRKADSLGEVSSFVLAKELSNIADTDASKCGFDNSESLAGALLGKGKSTLANYKRVGQYFINDDYTLKGAIPQETSISLLNQLLSFVITEDENGEPDIRNVEVFFKYGIITPYMKQADYKKVLKSLSEFMKRPSDKPLYDMDDDEIKDFIKAFKDFITPAKENKKQENKEQENKEQESENGEQEKTPQIVIGQSMSMIKTLEENFNYLGVSEEQKDLISTWLDNLYATLGELLGDTEQ